MALHHSTHWREAHPRAVGVHVEDVDRVSGLLGDDELIAVGREPDLGRDRVGMHEAREEPAIGSRDRFWMRKPEIVLSPPFKT